MSLFKSREQKTAEKLIKKARGNLISRVSYSRIGGNIHSDRPGVVKFYKNLVDFRGNTIPSYMITRIFVNSAIGELSEPVINIWLNTTYGKEFFFSAPCSNPDDWERELNMQLALVRIAPLLDEGSPISDDVAILQKIFGK